jgi:hypothetical protein
VTFKNQDANKKLVFKSAFAYYSSPGSKYDVKARNQSQIRFQSGTNSDTAEIKMKGRRLTVKLGSFTSSFSIFITS